MAARSSRISRFLLPLIVVVIGSLVGAYLVNSRPQAKPNPPQEKVRPVNVVRANFQSLQPSLKLYGQVIAGREAELRAMVAGRLVEVDPRLRSGAYVEQGAKLARIDNFDYELSVAEKNANLSEATALLAELEGGLRSKRKQLELIDEQIVLLERDLERSRNLVKKKQTSEKALDDVSLALNSGLQQRQQGVSDVNSLLARIEQQRAVVQRHEAQLRQANRNLDDTLIEAPFAGYLQDVSVAVGKRLAVAESVGRLIEADGLEVRFELPNADYARLTARGHQQMSPARHPLADTDVRVVWRLGGENFTFNAKVERVGAEVDATSGGIEVFARITDDDGGVIRPGAFVEVGLPDVRYERVIALPEAALSSDNTIYIVEASRLVPLEITVVREFGDEVYVTGDIPEGAPIVVEQFPAIGPGVLVQAM